MTDDEARLELEALTKQLMRTVLDGLVVRLMFLGVDPENLRRLRAGKQIFVDMAEFGIDACVMIQFGESMEAIVAELRAQGIDLPPVEDRRNDPRA